MESQGVCVLFFNNKYGQFSPKTTQEHYPKGTTSTYPPLSHVMDTLFETMRKYGQHVRTNRLDGKEAWDKAKATLSQLDTEQQLLQWAPRDYNQLYDHVHKNLGMRGEDTDPNTQDWERFHFVLQLVRIPLRNPQCTVVRLCQVAYNLGQLACEQYDDATTEWVAHHSAGGIGAFASGWGSISVPTGCFPTAPLGVCSFGGM